jgi:hypothetical protein
LRRTATASSARFFLCEEAEAADEEQHGVRLVAIVDPSDSDEDDEWSFSS